MERLKSRALSGHRLTSVLGLSLENGRVEAVVLRRTNGSAQVTAACSTALSLDPLTAPPELVGRELRNQLDSAGIRQRNCVLCLPLKWAIITHVEFPPLPPADLQSFLAIEAERNFPCEVTTLQVRTSRIDPVGDKGKGLATMVGVATSHLETLEKILRTAKLRPLSFTFGITALQPAGPASAQGVLALVLGESQLALQVSTREGIIALRHIDGAVEAQASAKVLHAEHVAREVRITLGQLPPEYRDKVKQVRIFGPRDLGQQLADELELRFEAQGMKVEVVHRYSGDEFGFKLPPETTVSPVTSLAARRLAGEAPKLEFLPPKVRPWKQALTRYSSTRLRTAAAVAAGVALLALATFGWQEWQLTRLNSQWNGMTKKVAELEATRQQIRQYRPWFDNNFTGLSLLRQLTLSFPEDGVVSAKTIEVRNLSTVTCSGVARDNSALLRTLEKLRATGGVNDLKVDQIRGKNPLQFTFDYRWSQHNEP